MFLFDDIDFVRTQDMPVSDLWYFLPFGFLLTVLIETPVLLFGLSPQIPLKQKFFCGIWLTACTYPIVVLVLPTLFFGESRFLYLVVAETFAPVAECFLFWLAFRNGPALRAAGWIRSFAAITAANLASFGLGEFMNSNGWFGIF